jgi:hypothetical protein
MSTGGGWPAGTVRTITTERNFYVLERAPLPIHFILCAPPRLPIEVLQGRKVLSTQHQCLVKLTRDR